MDKIQRLLPTDKLKPVSIDRGKALYGIICFEYTNTAVGPYNVVFGVLCLYDPLINVPILPALFERRFPVGFYVDHLPVTTKVAYDAGVDIWGCLRFLVEIEFEESRTTRRCSLEADEKEIITLDAKKGGDLKQDRWASESISILEESIGPPRRLKV